jgi:hypothetical protein
VTDQIHRTTPIQDSIEHVPPYPENFFIYKITASRFYQASARLDGIRAKKSLKTTSRAIAKTAATEFFEGLYSKNAQKIPLVESPNFGKVFEDLVKVDQRRVNGGKRKQSSVTDAQYIYKADLGKFFAKLNCKDITYQKMNEYIEYLQSREGRKPISDKTIKNHFIVLSKILTHAKKLGYLSQSPVFPSIDLDDNPRSSFDQIEYARLINTINDMIQAGVKGARFGMVTEELRLLTTFLVNSYLRPGDIYLMRHRDISLYMKNNKRFLKIYAQSKVAPSFVYCNETVTTTYSEVSLLNANSADAGDFVFWPKYKNRGYAKSLIAKQFNEALARANLKVGQTGAERTLYSLRHTCIMNRMTNGVPYSLPDLAAHARTSPGIITRFYGSHLTAEMNAEQFNVEPTNAPEQIGSTLEPFFGLD